MATCKLCNTEVETHRYLRAEPMKLENGKYTPVELKVTAFYHLTHPLEAIEESIASEYPPSEALPVRLLWSPAPGVRLPHWFKFQADNTPLIDEDTGRYICALCGEGFQADIHKAERQAVGVREARSRNGQHGVRTSIVGHRAGLGPALSNLLPTGVNWYIPHAGAAPADLLRTASSLLGGDDPLVEELRKRLEKGT